MTRQKIEGITETQWKKAKSFLEAIEDNKWSGAKQSLEQALAIYKHDSTIKNNATSGSELTDILDELKASLDKALELEQQVWWVFKAFDAPDHAGRGWTAERLSEIESEVGRLSHACSIAAQNIRKRTRPVNYARWRLIETVTFAMREFSVSGSPPTHKALQGLSKLLFDFLGEDPSPDICEQVLTKLRRETT
jgi:hypothetical protein